MRILLIGDSITDMCRNRNIDFRPYSYGSGYPVFIEGELSTKYPKEYEVYNRGISGDRSIDIYARIKKDCWNINPDIVSLLVGINDVWHEINQENGVDVDRYKTVYEMLINDTKKVLPNTRFILLEPFVLKGVATQNTEQAPENWEKFTSIYAYAKVVRELAKKYDCCFVPLQSKFDELSAKYGPEHFLFDGVHPSIAGAKIIAEEWLKAFYKNFR